MKDGTSIALRNKNILNTLFGNYLRKERWAYIVSEHLNNLKNDNDTARFPYLVLAVSIFLTVGITYNFYQSAKNKDLIRFTSEVNRIHLAIENKINLYVALLKGGRGFVESNREINRVNFAEYVKSLELENNYRGVQGIGYAKVVTAAEREALTKKMISEGYSDSSVFPAADKKSYQVIIYLEPLTERNQKAIGFDLSSEPNRVEALNRARDSGEAASSSKVILSQETEPSNQSGFLIFLPIYKNGGLPATVDERNKNITGYIFSPFRTNNFLNEIQNDKSVSDIALRIYDGQPSAENLLTKTGDLQESAFANQIEENYTTENELNVAGRKWIIQYDSTPSFIAQSSLGWTPFIFIIGIIFSFLLFGMTYWETSTRIKLQTTAAELFELEKQKQGLLEKEQKARLSAEQANNTKDEFIAVVSHELRTR